MCAAIVNAFPFIMYVFLGCQVCFVVFVFIFMGVGDGEGVRGGGGGGGSSGDEIVFYFSLWSLGLKPPLGL